jgi:hypothetical protein
VTGPADPGGIALQLRDAALHLGYCTLALRAGHSAVASHHVRAALRCVHLAEGDLAAQARRREQAE